MSLNLINQEILGDNLNSLGKGTGFPNQLEELQLHTVPNDFYSKLVGNEMHLYKIYPKERPRYLQLLYKALKTIKPTSVEAKRAFSAMGFFVTKLRNRMSDKTLDALITMRQRYKKPKKATL